MSLECGSCHREALSANGSTEGTDIIAAIINKDRNITLENGAYLRYDYHFLQSFCIERPGKSGDGFVTLYICSFAIDQGNE